MPCRKQLRPLPEGKANCKTHIKTGADEDEHEGRTRLRLACGFGLRRLVAAFHFCGGATFSSPAELLSRKRLRRKPKL